jgi:hypothetical protein
MTKAQIVTQFRVWAKENDDTSEVTDAQIYAYIDTVLGQWIVKVAEQCGLAGFVTYTEDTKAVTSGVSANLTSVPLVVIEAAADFGGSYRTMKRVEGGFQTGDDRIQDSSYARMEYRVKGQHIETSPAGTGNAKVIYIAEQSAFSAVSTTVPTNMCTLAENGLACYAAGVYWSNQDNGDAQSQRCFGEAGAFLRSIPRGFR